MFLLFDIFTYIPSMLVARQNVYLDAENIFNSSCDGAHLKQEKET